MITFRILGNTGVGILIATMILQAIGFIDLYNELALCIFAALGWGFAVGFENEVNKNKE